MSGDRTARRAWLETLNDRQREAVLHEGSPLLILAGAGSGKTRVITTKIAHLIADRGVDPRSILAVTFTNKAAREMGERASRLEPRAAGAMIRTFHSFGAWLLRRHAPLLEMQSHFSIYDDDDVLSLLGSLFPDLTRGQLRQYANRISRAKDYGLGPGDDLYAVSGDPEFALVYGKYEERLRQIGNADFGDLILLPVRLFERSPEVRERIRQRFRVILVDEYQDSNVAQFRFLQLLAGPDTYLCVVGDDDQSIYRFRGAEVRNIVEFPERFPGTSIIKLEENYRSTKNILDIASRVVNNNRGRLGKTLWTRNEEGSMVSLTTLESAEAEAEYCARLLEGVDAGSTAILYRTNAQSRLFESLFVSSRIPYRVVGTLRFYEREEVKDTLAVLRLLANPRDEVAFRRIVNKPARGIGQASLEKVLDRTAEADFDLLAAAGLALPHLPSRAGKGVQEFLSLMQRLAGRLEETTLQRFVENVVTETGLLEYHRRQDEYAGQQKVANLEELMNAAALYEGGMEGLSAFLQDIELDSAQESPQAEEGNPITLITMHNTKGLEFDRVIITGLEEGLFPRGGDEDLDELEEERRLFYVAITRARKQLHLTTCRTRRIRGKTEFLSPSRFLKEIPGELLESGGGGAPGQQEDGYEPGTYVYHDAYGTGVIVRKWYNGPDMAVQVSFESGRVAVFIPKYQPLEKVSID